MVCIFCIAVLAIVAGALTSASLDDMEEGLASKAADGVKRVSDTESVTRFELTVDVSGKKAPVVVTLYKEHARARIQVLTHELSPDEVERLEDDLAEAIGAKVVDRSGPEPDDHTHEAAEPERAEAPERERAPQAADPQRDREREPEPPRG